MLCRLDWGKMKMKKTTSGMTLILLLTIMLTFTFNVWSTESEGQLLTRVEKAVDLLINSQFNKSLSLCREAPNVARNIIGLFLITFGLGKR